MILDEYTLEKCLGKGAFGEVYLTTKKGTSQLFATKKLPKELFENQTTKKYILNEIYILKTLNHPNIAKFLDLKRTNNHYYIIMEYCNGGELQKALESHISRTGKPFSQEIVQYLMKQIISAFKYIHESKIIHRDIKLENILINYDNNDDKKNENIMKAQIKIIDFGFAAKIEKQGLKYTALGSPSTMDPLILNELKKRGKKTGNIGYDQKADIWSLGTICYELAIGKCVFDANKIDELVEKIEKGEYTVPTSLSKELISFINGMLQYDPKRRLTIGQLANHRFLTKNINEFERIDFRKVNKNLVKSRLKLNVKQNQTIWAMFDEEDEKKLMQINSDYGNDKPITEDQSFENKLSNKYSGNIINNNNNIYNVNANNKRFSLPVKSKNNIDNNASESTVMDNVGNNNSNKINNQVLNNKPSLQNNNININMNRNNTFPQKNNNINLNNNNGYNLNQNNVQLKPNINNPNPNANLYNLPNNNLAYGYNPQVYQGNVYVNQRIQQPMMVYPQTQVNQVYAIPNGYNYVGGIYNKKTY